MLNVEHSALREMHCDTALKQFVKGLGVQRSLLDDSDCRMDLLGEINATINLDRTLKKARLGLLKPS